jgi:hypothetical protein
MGLSSGIGENVIDLPLTWRLVLFVAAVGLLPTLVLVNWLAQQWARSVLGARLRGWWRSWTG